MNFRNINSQQNTNQVIKLASIFSIFFVSVFYMANILTEDKGDINVIYNPRAQVPTSESSLTMVSNVESEDLQSSQIILWMSLKSQSSQEQVLLYQALSMPGN